MKAFQELIAREREAADQLAQRAKVVGFSAVTPLLIAVAKVAVSQVTHSDEEPAADLLALRSDPRLLAATEFACQELRTQAWTEMRTALLTGYSDDIRWRSALVQEESNGLEISVRHTTEEMMALRDYPILGHTAAESADHLEIVFRYALDGVFAQPITGAIDLRALPVALGSAGRMHAERLMNATREAYFAGVQAATKALTAALTGA